MHILIVHNSVIPAYKYGGTQRVIWYLGKELHKQGFKVSYLVKQGSVCDFADIYNYNMDIPLSAQIPSGIDVIHFNCVEPDDGITLPYIVSQHGNMPPQLALNKNTVFVSLNHAQRHGSERFVYNGLDWDDYGQPDFHLAKEHFHFLGKAAWRLKNVKGAINAIKQTPSERLVVLGGTRLNLKMGFRFTASSRVSFKGMVGGEDKYKWMKNSKGLIFPVNWHEPFGLAITESLYFGNPIFATPYGSLPELVTPEVGFLTNSCSDLSEALLNSNQYDKKICHEMATDLYNARVMAEEYIKLYAIVLNGQYLNEQHPASIIGAKDIGEGWKR